MRVQGSAKFAHSLPDDIRLAVDAEQPPALAARANEKHQHYAPLQEKGESQALRGIRTHAPTFYAAIISRVCEFSDNTFQLIEWLASIAYAHNLRDPDLACIPSKKASSSTRTRLKDSLVIACATGWGQTLRCAGFPTFSTST